MFELEEGMTMKALYKGRPAYVWEISKTGERPEWIEEALSKNNIYWLDNRVRILMTALRPPVVKKLKMGEGGTIGGGVDALGVYAYGYVSDFLDATNQRVVSKERFLKHYQILGV